MATFAAPKPKPKHKEEIETFLGADLSSAPNNVDLNRSPSCPNMIRDEVGKVKKRGGIQLVDTFTGNINGVHFLYGTTTKKLVHAGTKIYYVSGLTHTQLYASAADHISVSKQMGGKLWILDGTTYLVYDGSTIQSVSAIAYTPTIIIARTPTGGGTVLEPVNLLQPQRTERFAGTASTTVYQLTATSIDAAAVTVKKLKSDGTFDTWVETTNFTVNRTLGQVTFSVAPGVTPITGEDNVYITYSKTVTGYADRINKCDVSIIYGMNGARDRLFVTGNPSLPHYDYHSQMDDPTYFGDTNYAVIGQDSSAIMNYSIVSDYLVTHKNNAENDDNTNLRKGELIDGKVVFTSQGSYQTSGALSKYSFANLENEPLYVTTEKNISAVTPSSILGERFSQERSYWITRALEEEADLANSFGFVFDKFYFLAVGSTIYVLDSLQYSIAKDRPLAYRQYECYYFPNVSARVMWEEDGYLHFGTTDGKVKRFVDGTADDEGQAISAWWDTPFLDGKSFADKKTFVYIAVRLASALLTGIKISAFLNGNWTLIKDYTSEANFFTITNDTLDFSNLSFSTDSSPKTLGSKIKEKNYDKIQFRFENSRLYDTFGLYKILIEYTEGNKYRK